LNHGLDPGSNPIGPPTKWVIGVGVNPGAVDLDRELSRFAWKVDAGAEFAVTQPVFDAAAFADMLRQAGGTPIPILAGIMPLESLRHAEFMANEVPGVQVPDAVVERMRRAENDGRAQAEGILIAREVATEIRPLVQGLQISTAAGAVDAALEVMEAAAF